MAENAYVLEMKNIVKTFPGVQALKGVNLNVRAGEVHALMGENGAGKSTIMKCLIGIHPPTSGQIFFEGKELKNLNTKQVLESGISMIHQELSPVLDRSIMENIWLGREPLNKFGLVDHKKMYDMTKDVLKIVNLEEDPKTEMGRLTVAKMQMIEIAKAISYNARLIIMDEPSSAITEHEVKQLFNVIRKLRTEGKSIIYISHKLDEIKEITDMITVFRDGEYIGTEKTAELSQDKMINMMVGRDVKDMFPKVDCPIGEVLLEVQGLSDGKHFKDVSFQLRRGEILGLAGLVGSGRTEIIETIFGARQKTAGKIFVSGKEVHIKLPEDAIRHGMALLTEDRRETGIFPMLTVEHNMIISNMKKYIGKNGLIESAKIKVDCDKYVEAISIKTPSTQQQIQNLSGGNQQKVLVARWLLTEPDILFLDEPTRGIDVGAKSEIHKIVTSLAGQGKAIIMVSSEMPEILGMSDRVAVMCTGKMTGILDNKDLTQEMIMTYASDAAATSGATPA